MANRYPTPMKNEVYEKGDILLVAYNRDPAPVMPSSDYARITIYNCLPHLEKKNLLECTEKGDPCHSFVVDEEAVWDQRNWQMPPDTQELWAAYDPSGRLWEHSPPKKDRWDIERALWESISPDYEALGYRIRKVIVALASEMVVEEVEFPKRRPPAKKKKKSRKKKPSRKSDI